MINLLVKLFNPKNIFTQKKLKQNNFFFCRPNYELFARSFYATACCLLLFCQVNIFRLPSYLMPVFLSMAGHQYSGVCTKSTSSQNTKDGLSKSDRKMSKKKQKWKRDFEGGTDRCLVSDLVWVMTSDCAEERRIEPKSRKK